MSTGSNTTCRGPYIPSKNDELAFEGGSGSGSGETRRWVVHQGNCLQGCKNYVIEEESEFIRDVRTNRAKLRGFLSSKSLESSYISSL
jgi:hypothetical protein